jgi:hypothetical protein
MIRYEIRKRWKLVHERSGFSFQGADFVHWQQDKSQVTAAIRVRYIKKLFLKNLAEMLPEQNNWTCNKLTWTVPNVFVI